MAIAVEVRGAGMGRVRLARGAGMGRVRLARGAGMGRVRLARVPYAGKAALHPFVADAVEPGATLHTDAWKGYDDIEQLGYARIATNLSASGDPAHVHMPRVHRVASLLKRWWIGTHQGAIRRRHLDFYLDEFAFRFNRRGSTARGLLFYRLVEQAVAVDHTPYANLLGGKETKLARLRRTRPAPRHPARRVSVSLPLGAKAPPGGRRSSNRVALPGPTEVRAPASPTPEARPS